MKQPKIVSVFWKESYKPFTMGQENQVGWIHCKVFDNHFDGKRFENKQQIDIELANGKNIRCNTVKAYPGTWKQSLEEGDMVGITSLAGNKLKVEQIDHFYIC